MATIRKSLDNLFHETLNDIYYAEKLIVEALPDMSNSATSEELKKSFMTHLNQTQRHLERLDQVFEMIGKVPKGATREAAHGIIQQAKEVMDQYSGSAALDDGLISSAQAVEHYEIARYGTLVRWAERLGYNDAADLLDETVEEEKETDEILTQIANEKK